MVSMLPYIAAPWILWIIAFGRGSIIATSPLESVDLRLPPRYQTIQLPNRQSRPIFKSVQGSNKKTLCTRQHPKHYTNRVYMHTKQPFVLVMIRFHPPSISIHIGNYSETCAKMWYPN